MSQQYNATDLFAKMTDPDGENADFVRTLVSPPSRAAAYGPRETPWAAANRIAEQARRDADCENHARLLRELTALPDQQQLALYLSEAIAHALEHGNRCLGATAAWKLEHWELGMPDPAARQFSVCLMLAVPGQHTERAGALYFHLDVSAAIVEAVLLHPARKEDPISRGTEALTSLGADLGRALFNVVVAMQKRNGQNTWTLVRQDIARALRA